VSWLAFVLPAAASAEQPHLLSYAKSSSMFSNTTNVINGVPKPGTLLLLDGQPFTVRSVPLGEVKAGETIKALSEVEVTNDVVTKDGQGTNLYHDVGAALTLIIADSPTSTTGIEVAEAQGNYVTPQMHHWTFEKSGSYTAVQDQSGKYLNLVMWAYSAEPISDCWTFPRSSLPDPQEPRACGMDVDYDRGHLSALRTGPAATLPAGATPFSIEQFSGTSLPEASPSDVPITYGSEPAQFIVGMSRPVGALQTNDVLTAHTELQVDARNTVRSNASCNVQVATRIYLAPSPNSLTGARAIGAEAGYNFTGKELRQIRTLERGVVPSSTTFKLDQAYAAPRYVVLRVWTKGNSACALYGNGIRVQLDQPASFMHVMRYRPEQQANLVVETTNSGDGSELVSQLNTLTGEPATAYSRELTGLAPGDLIEALGEVEVNTSHHRAEVHTSPVLADSPTATTGVGLQVDNFTEVSPYMASLPMHDATGWVVPAGTGSHQYLNMVIRAPRLGTLGTAPDDFIGVGPDDGRLLVQQFRRPRTAAPQITDTDPDSPANDNAPEVKGTAEAGTTMKLYESTDCTGPIEAQGAAATFASPGFTAAVAADSVASFTATATDAPGNVSPCSSPFAYAEDSTPPATPGSLASSPAPPANENGPEVRGTAEAGATVRVYKAATSSDCTAGNLAATGSAAGFSSPGLTVSVADNSTTVLRATATDAAGNVSTCSGSAITYEEDSIAPSPPTSLAVAPASPANNNNPELSGNAEAGSTVKVYKAATSSDCTAGNLAATGSAAGFTSPGLSAPVPDTTTTAFRATATDGAGNVSACSSSSVSYQEDSSPPSAPTLTGSDPGSPANDNAPEVEGVAEDGSTVRLYQSADCTGPVEVEGTAAAFASPGLTVSVGDDITAAFGGTATDAAGNASSCSEAYGFTEDSSSPETTIYTGPSRRTRKRRARFSFGAGERGSTLRCKLDRRAFELCSSPAVYRKLRVGRHLFQVWATDQAGNVEAGPAVLRFRVLRRARRRP